MTKIIDVKVTPQGVQIPRTLVEDWVEVQMIKSGQQIIIRPKEASEQGKREKIIRALRAAKLTSPLNDELAQQAAPISPARRAELAQALAGDKPLSEIILEERAERW